MTRSLYVLRHGKSDWSVDEVDDHERPLTRRGRRAARLVGHALTELDQAPQKVVSSSAVRARRTVELAAKAGGWDCPIHVTEALYGAGPRTCISLARRIKPSVERLLLAGHESSCSTLLQRLLGGGQVRFPTAALARIDFELESWADLRAGSGMLVWLQPPRFLAALLQEEY